MVNLWPFYHGKIVRFSALFVCPKEKKLFIFAAVLKVIWQNM